MVQNNSEKWFAVWVNPSNFANSPEGYTSELVLVKAVNEEEAAWEAEERLVRRYRNTRDFVGSAHEATSEDFARYKAGNRFEWVSNDTVVACM